MITQKRIEILKLGKITALQSHAKFFFGKIFLNRGF
jgi:hypothetical protein